jgi:integrase
MSNLTQQFVKVVDKLGSYQDGRGLILKVTKTGKKSWIYRYQYEGRRHDMSLGGYPALSLKDARLEADLQRLDLAKGIDPLVKRHNKRHEERIRTKKAEGFKNEALSYYRTHQVNWSEKHAQEWLSSMVRHVFPVIGHVAPEEIGTEEVLSVLRPIWMEIPETALRVRNRIELVLDAAKAKGLRSGDNPAKWKGHLDKLLPKQNKQSNPFESMPHDEIGDFLRELDATEGVAARACELLIYTACRNKEVAGARWEEFDLERKLWVIPASRMKAGKEHKVPLTEPAMDLLKNLQGNDPEHVFPSKRRAGHIPTNAIGRVLSAITQQQFVPHGFRASFRTWAANCTNHQREVCEMALAHTLESKVEAAYNRGDLLDKRRQLMSDWSAYITKSLEEIQPKVKLTIVADHALEDGDDNDVEYRMAS